MASDRAKKLLSLALENRNKSSTQNYAVPIPNNAFDARNLPVIEEDSGCTNKTNDISFVLDSPSETALILPWEDIENYSIVENRQVEIFDAFNFSATDIHTTDSCDVPIEQANIIYNLNIAETNVDTFDSDSPMMPDNDHSNFAENAQIIESLDAPDLNATDIPTSDYALIERANTISDENMLSANADTRTVILYLTSVKNSVILN